MLLIKNTALMHHAFSDSVKCCLIASGIAFRVKSIDVTIVIMAWSKQYFLISDTGLDQHATTCMSLSTMNGSDVRSM